MLETQLTQLASAVSPTKCGKTSAYPKTSRENINAVTTRGGKTTQDPPNPNRVSKETVDDSDEEQLVSLTPIRCTMGKRLPMNFVTLRSYHLPPRSGSQAQMSNSIASWTWFNESTSVCPCWKPCECPPMLGISRIYSLTNGPYLPLK